MQLLLIGANDSEGPIAHILLYINYIYICNKLLIRANNCEGDYVHVAFTINVGDTHAVAFTIIGSY